MSNNKNMMIDAYGNYVEKENNNENSGFKSSSIVLLVCGILIGIVIAIILTNSDGGARTIADKYVKAYMARDTATLADLIPSELYDDNTLTKDIMKKSMDKIFDNLDDMGYKIKSVEIVDDGTSISVSKLKERNSEYFALINAKTDDISEVVEYKLETKIEDDEGEVTTTNGKLYIVKYNGKWRMFPAMS